MLAHSLPQAMLMLLELIRHIYLAVDDPLRWTDFLEMLLEDRTFVAAAVGYQPDLRDTMITGILHGVDPENTERLYSEIIPNNPLMMTDLILGPGPHAMLDHEILEREQFEKTLYHQWIQDIGASGLLACVHREEQSGAVHFPCYIARGARVEEHQRERMRTLLPHITHALALSRKLQELELLHRHSLDAMDRAHFGCLLIKPDRRVEWHNDYAEAILSRGDALVIKGDVLRAIHPEEDAGLQEDIDVALGLCDARSGRGRPVHRIRKAPGSTGHLELLVSPLSPFGHPVLADRTGALLMLADPEYLEEGIAKRLERLYALTPAESEVTQWLLSGSSIDDIATIFGKSPHTVRHQIKHVMKKCNVSSQAQLVGLIHRGVAILQDAPRAS